MTLSSRAFSKEMDPKGVEVYIQDFLRNDVEEAGPGKHEVRRLGTEPEEEFFSDVHKLCDLSLAGEQEHQKLKENEEKIQKAEMFLNLARRQVDNIHRIIGYSFEKKIVTIQKIVPEQTLSEELLDSKHLATLLIAKKQQFSAANDIFDQGLTSIRNKIDQNRLFMKQVSRISDFWKLSLPVGPENTNVLSIDVNPLPIKSVTGKDPVVYLKSSATHDSGAVLDVSSSDFAAPQPSADIFTSLLGMQRDHLIKCIFYDLCSSSDDHFARISGNTIRIYVPEFPSLSIERKVFPNPRLYIKGLSEFRALSLENYLIKTTLSHYSPRIDRTLRKPAQTGLYNLFMQFVTHFSLCDQIYVLIKELEKTYSIRTSFFRSEMRLEIEIATKTAQYLRIRIEGSSIVLLRSSMEHPFGFSQPLSCIESLCYNLHEVLVE